MKLDQIRDERVTTLRKMFSYRQSRLARGEGNAHFQKEELRALGWALAIIRHAAERGILVELEKEPERKEEAREEASPN